MFSAGRKEICHLLQHWEPRSPRLQTRLLDDTSAIRRCWGRAWGSQCQGCRSCSASWGPQRVTRTSEKGIQSISSVHSTSSHGGFSNVQTLHSWWQHLQGTVTPIHPRSWCCWGPHHPPWGPCSHLSHRVGRQNTVSREHGLRWSGPVRQYWDPVLKSQHYCPLNHPLPLFLLVCHLQVLHPPPHSALASYREH